MGASAPALTMTEIAAQINAHLKRFEKDPVINAKGPYGKPYRGASAIRTGSRIRITFPSNQRTLKVWDAFRYLLWLDAGNIGRYGDMEAEGGNRG